MPIKFYLNFLKGIESAWADVFLFEILKDLKCPD